MNLPLPLGKRSQVGGFVEPLQVPSATPTKKLPTNIINTVIAKLPFVLTTVETGFDRGFVPQILISPSVSFFIFTLDVMHVCFIVYLRESLLIN